MSTLSVGTIKSISSAPPVFKNTSGTEKGQLCLAWVNFNGEGTLTSSDQSGVRDSFNISSVIDEGTGKYTVNFQDTLSDPCGAVSASYNANAFDTNYSDVATPYISNTACQVITPNMEGVPYGGLHDCDYGYGVIFSDD